MSIEIELGTNEWLNCEHYSGFGDRDVYFYKDPSDGEIFSVEVHGEIKECRKIRDAFLERKKQNKDEYEVFSERHHRFCIACIALAEGEAMWMEGNGFSPSFDDRYKYSKSPDCNIYLSFRIHDFPSTTTVHGETLEDCVQQINAKICDPNTVGDPSIDKIDMSKIKKFL